VFGTAQMSRLRHDSPLSCVLFLFTDIVRRAGESGWLCRYSEAFIMLRIPWYSVWKSGNAVCFPVAQIVKSSAGSAKVFGSLPRESLSWWNTLKVALD